MTFEVDTYLLDRAFPMRPASCGFNWHIKSDRIENTSCILLIARQYHLSPFSFLQTIKNLLC